MSKKYTYEDILALFAETDRKMNERDEKWKKKMKELSKQIGGINNKFDEFTENLFMNSLEKLLNDRFSVQEFIPNACKSIKNVGDIEIDALGVVNGDINSVYVTEIKTKFDKDAIEQLKKIMSKMNTFYPDLKDKKKFGIIALPNLKSEHKNQIMNAGFIPVSLKDDLAIIKSPDDFVPKNF